MESGTPVKSVIMANNYVKYICSVEANYLGLNMPQLVALFGGKMNEHALLLTPNEKAGLIPSLRQ